MKKKYFKSPDKGFEDFEPNNLKNQSSQTFFRIKTPCNTLKNSSTSHCRTQTQTFPENDSKNDYFTGFNSKKPRNLEEIENEHDSQMKNIETLTKIKRKCGEFLESQEKIMSSPLVSYLMKGIKILANMRFEYRELLNFYPTIFHKALYISPELISEYKELIENVENERIQNYVKMNRISNCPYTVFCGSILEEHRNKMQQNEDKLIGIVKKNQELMNQNNQNNQMITTLNEIIEKQQNEERNSPHSTKLIQMKMELNKLQAENNDLKNCSQILSLKNFSLDSEVTELRQRLELTTGTCSSLENKCDIITAEKEKTIKEYEDKISNFKLFKIQAADLKNTLDKILLKMSTIKQYFLKSQQERSELLQERQDLVIRAAVGFDNLTPRPNYTQLCIDKNLSFSSLIPKLERKKKTNSFYIVDILLNKICEYQAKIAFMDAELKDKKRQGDFVISQQMRKASTTNQKSSFRGVGASPSKSSKMISVDGLDKRSRFITINTDEDSKIIKDKDSNKESPEKNTGVFDFKMEFLKNEEEGDKKEEHGEEREEVKETERIISEIIESKKKIEQFGILK